MGIFSNLKSEGLQQSEDRLGGFQIFESDIYTAEVKMMYAGKSKDGAHNVTVVLDLGGKEYSETIYITSKKGENFYMTPDNKKAPLPGFTTINEICLITTGKELNVQDTEEKTVKVYDPDVKQQVPKAVQMLTDAIGQKVSVGILKQLENKSVKNDATGKYEATPETRDTNAIDKVFHPEFKVTVPEAREEKEAAFWDSWLKRNKGQTRDKRTIKDGAGAAASGAPPKPGAPAAAAPKKSLFGK